MMSAEDKKVERSKAKMAVTVASRRFIGAVNRGCDYDISKNLIMELEKVYDDFCNVNEEFEIIVCEEENAEHRVVNGEDIKTYRESVNKSYQDARNLFTQVKKENEEIARKQIATPVRAALRNDICRIYELITVIDKNFDYDNINPEAVQLDKKDLQSILNAICDNMTKLCSIEDQDISIQGEVDEIVSKVYDRIRKINWVLHEQKSPVKPPIFGKPHSSEASNSDANEVLITTGPTLNDSPLSITPPSATKTNSTLVHDTINTSINNAPPHETLDNTTTTDVTQSDPFDATHSNYAFPIPPGNLLNTSAQTFIPTSTTHSESIPGINPLGQPPWPQQSQAYANSLGSNPIGMAPSGLAVSQSNQPNITSIPYTNATYPVYTSAIGLQPITSVQDNVSIKPQTHASTIALKKMSLPTFSGLRKDWPEFKAVWRSLAETAQYNKTTLAHQLKQSVKGEARLRIKSVYVTKPEAYNIMWEKLELHYEDTSASVQAALEDLQRLKPVKDEDYKGLVELVDEVESAYSQLDELNQLNTLTMRDVDGISDLLPTHLKVDWRRKYRELSPGEKLQPFTPFMKFLERERAIVARLAENQQPKRRVERMFGNSHHVERDHKYQPSRSYHKCAFPTHRKDTTNHSTEQCKEFQKLPVSGKDGKYEMLKQVNACFVCFGNHRKQNCPKNVSCSSCGSKQHHPLLCIPKFKPSSEESNENKESATYLAGSDSMALYPIYQANVSDSNRNVSVFCDGGSNASYITHRAADRIKAKKVKKLSLDVTTMGNVDKTYNTWQYEFEMNTSSGKKVLITAFGMERITGPVSRLDPEVLIKLFPDYDPQSLQRKSSYVDVLLGCDYFGLHPKREEARNGENLSIMSGALGICLQGAHPDLVEETKYDTNLAKKIHDVNVRVETYQNCVESHPEFHSEKSQYSLKASRSFGNQKEENQVDNFIQGEELGTETIPKCGGCRCNKCPTIGHTYSFKEEQELKLIQENLEYDETNQRWITSYPWLMDPHTLPNNYNTAYATLQRTERQLQKDNKWADTYKNQMNDMVERGVARKLSMQEVNDWKGPEFYISHLAVLNPRSHSTPVRIVFNSSQTHKGVSLNSYLAKGPDCYMNNLIGVLLRWREERVAMIGDIRKMFNAVHLKALEQHCHRFLWRDLEQSRPPDIYIIQRVNMGDTPAPVISTEAVYKTVKIAHKQLIS